MARIAGVIGCAHPIALTEELINRMTHRGSKHKGVTGFHNVALGMSKFEKSEKDSVDLPLKIPLYEAVAAFDGILYNTLWKHSGISPAPVSEDEFIENMISNNNEILQSDGMYALAWATYRSQSIKLKRDRFGIKPLFWRNLENGQAFASEILPLVKLNQNISRIRQRSVAEFLAFGKALGSNTFYQGVYRVRPGSTVELSRDKKILVNNITVAMEQNISGSLRNALKTSIQRSLKPGRHIGLGISGGLDSTLLAFEMNAMGLNDIITVSLKIAGVNDGIDDLNSLDLPTNGSWNSWKHYAVSFSPHDFDEMMNRSVQIFGEPTKMTSVPLYIKLAEAAKACGIDVLIVGEGADEIFAGYPSYLEWIQKYRHGFSVYDSLQEFAFPAKRRRWLKNLL